MDVKKMKKYRDEVERLKKEQNRFSKENDIIIKKLAENRLRLKEDIIPTHSILSQIHSKYFNIVIAFFTFFSGLYALIEILNWLEPNLNNCQRYISLFTIAIILLIALSTYIVIYSKESKRFSESLKALWDSYDKKIQENNVKLGEYTSKFNKIQKQINELETKIGTEAFVNKK